MNLDDLAKLAPFHIHSTGHGGDVFCGDDWEELEPSYVAAALNEWAELRAYRERTEESMRRISEFWTRKEALAGIHSLRCFGLMRDPAPKEATDE